MSDLLMVLAGFTAVAVLPLWALTRRIDQPHGAWPAGLPYPRYAHRRRRVGRHRHIDDAELPDDDRRNLEAFREAKRHARRVAHLGWPAGVEEWQQRRQERSARVGGTP